MSKLKLALLVGVALAPCAAYAQTRVENLPSVDVVASQPQTSRLQTRAAAASDAATTRSGPAVASSEASSSNGTLAGQSIAAAQAATPDAAQMLTALPGVDLYQAGGVSSLPVVHGFADDRNRILLGGVDIASACANHMNPALSYIDSTMVGKAEAITSNVPVSRGGDSIGGAIVVTPKTPTFARADQAVTLAGSLSTYYRSVNKGTTVAASVSAATRHFAISYEGAWARGDNYKAGGGHKVLSTSFRAQNHAATLAYENEGQLLTLRGAYQSIPRQGFPNQWMDMLGNEAASLAAGYKGAFGWGRLEADAYWHRVNHYMNFLGDKGGSTPTTGMPMHTRGQNFGASLKGEIALSKSDTLRAGAELRGQRLDDWWPPVAGGMGMMCCNTFWNIRDGQRDRLGVYAEWEKKWASRWTTTLGARSDVVWMNAGKVQGYNGMMYGADAAAFNARSHAKTDVNLDLSAVARYEAGAHANYEAGYTRKTRSPNLHERYAWSTNGMASSMNNWFGDLNGYVGNLNLKPEVAHTLSATARWHDGERWEVKVTPYFSYVESFIDADKIKNIMGGFAVLRLANHDARLYGLDVSGRARLMESVNFGTLSLVGKLGYVRGVNLDTHANLYNIMPINGKAALEHNIALYGGRLTSSVEAEAVGSKTQVNSPRDELKTPSYALVNLRTSYAWQNLRFDLGVENLLDRRYYAPLSGKDVSGPSLGLGLYPVAAPGRSIYGGMTVKF